jgi:hypothetical protein
MRAVGFLNNKDNSGWSRSTNATSELPKASILAGDAPVSGK